VRSFQVADEPKPKAKPAAAAARNPRPRKPAAANEAPTVVSGPAVRTLTRNERETLRARLQKRFH
jgi:hypothetical protein